MAYGDRSSAYPFRSSYQLFRAAWNTWKPQVNDRRLTFLSVWTLDLRPASRQTGCSRRRWMKALSHALDNITDRFGEDTVIWARCGGVEHARTVGFRKTVSWDVKWKKSAGDGSLALGFMFSLFLLFQIERIELTLPWRAERRVVLVLRVYLLLPIS